VAVKELLGRTTRPGLEQDESYFSTASILTAISNCCRKRGLRHQNTSRPRPSAAQPREPIPSLRRIVGGVFQHSVFRLDRCNRAAACPPKLPHRRAQTRWCAGCGCPAGCGLRPASTSSTAEDIAAGLRESDPASPTNPTRSRGRGRCGALVPRQPGGQRGRHRQSPLPLARELSAPRFGPAAQRLVDRSPDQGAADRGERLGSGFSIRQRHFVQ